MAATAKDKKKEWKNKSKAGFFIIIIITLSGVDIVAPQRENEKVKYN